MVPRISIFPKETSKMDTGTFHTHARGFILNFEGILNGPAKILRAQHLLDSPVRERS